MFRLGLGTTSGTLWALVLDFWLSLNIENTENTVPQILKNRYLLANESKTEKYTVERKNGSNQWKTCKYVRSLLDTQQDIKKKNP